MTKTVFVSVPSGTSLTGLVASFASTGDTVMIGNTLRTNGVIANDFTRPVIHTVRTYDGTAVNYSVIVIAVASDSKDITNFELARIAGTINDTDISILHE